jgi:hypothetical protein
MADSPVDATMAQIGERKNLFVFFTIELDGFEFVERIRERQQRPMRVQQ